MEIPEDVLGNITFKAIVVGGHDFKFEDGMGGNECVNLREIDPKAFYSSSNRTQYLAISASKLNPNSLIGFINSFENLKVLNLLDSIDLNNKTFGKSFSHLTLIVLNVNSIEGSPFYEFSNIENFYLYGSNNSKLSHIPTNAFKFGDRITRKNLMISFSDYNQLNGSSFEVGTFNNLKANVVLDFRSNINFNYLEEKVFAPFFDENDENRIHMWETVDDNNCKNYWIIKNKEKSRRYKIEITPIWENEKKFDHCK